MNRPILILSNIIIDDLWFADGSNLPNTLGGAATYASVAARLWWDEVAIIAGVGADLDTVTAGKLAASGLRPEGHLVRSPHTIQSRLVYRADGGRTETPAYGPDHFASLQVLPDDIPAALLPAAATYVFRDLDMAYWASLMRVRDRLGTVLWELQDDGIAGRWAEIAALMPMVDIFSCNRSEARSLLGERDPLSICRAIIAAGAKVAVLRLGEQGSLVMTSSACLAVAPPPSPVIDVTGGGNAFCGGFLAGWLIGGDLETAARSAAASAAHALRQYGPGDPLDRRSATALAAATGIQHVTEGSHEPVR